MLGPAMRRRMRLDRLRIGRLEAEAAGAIDRADQHLQHMQRARRLEPVGMGRQAAHGMERHRPADEALVALAVHVGPWLLDDDRLVEGDAGDLGRKAADGGGGDAGLGRDRFRRVFFGRGIFRRATGTTARQNGRPASSTRPESAGRAPLRADGHDLLGHGLVDQRPALGVAREQPVVGRAGRVDHQPGGIGIADQIVDVDLARLEQFMDDREDQQSVGAGTDADPVVGDRRIAGAHRVDRNEARAALLQLGDAHLDRVGIVVFGHPEHDEQLGAVPVRRAELPERAADGHDAGRRHVDRAEAAMGGIVGRAELLRPEPGQRLRLVAAGEEGELLRVVVRGPSPSQSVAIASASSQEISLNSPEPRGPVRSSGALSLAGA